MRYYFVVIKRSSPGTSLAVQWLGLCLLMHRVQVQFLVRDLIAHMPHSQKTKQKQCCNKFNKDFKKKKKERERSSPGVRLAWIKPQLCHLVERGAWPATVRRGHKESDTTEQLSTTQHCHLVAEWP